MSNFHSLDVVATSSKIQSASMQVHNGAFHNKRFFLFAIDWTKLESRIVVGLMGIICNVSSLMHASYVQEVSVKMNNLIQSSIFFIHLSFSADACVSVTGVTDLDEVSYPLLCCALLRSTSPLFLLLRVVGVQSKVCGCRVELIRRVVML